MSTTTMPKTCAPARTKHGLELARYTVAGGTRILYGQRTLDGEAIVIDVPADGNGRVYLVERDVEPDGNAALRALIEDYREAAARHQAIPMTCSPLD